MCDQKRGESVREGERGGERVESIFQRVRQSLVAVRSENRLFFPKESRVAFSKT